MTHRGVTTLVFHIGIDAACQQHVRDLQIATRSRSDQNGATVAVLRVWIYAGVEEGVNRHHVARLGGSKETLLVKIVTTQLE